MHEPSRPRSQRALHSLPTLSREHQTRLVPRIQHCGGVGITSRAVCLCSTCSLMTIGAGSSQCSCGMPSARSSSSQGCFLTTHHILPDPPTLLQRSHEGGNSPTSVQDLICAHLLPPARSALQALRDSASSPSCSVGLLAGSLLRCAWNSLPALNALGPPTCTSPC